MDLIIAIDGRVIDLDNERDDLEDSLKTILEDAIFGEKDIQQDEEEIRIIEQNLIANANTASQIIIDNLFLRHEFETPDIERTYQGILDFDENSSLDDEERKKVIDHLVVASNKKYDEKSRENEQAATSKKSMRDIAAAIIKHRKEIGLIGLNSVVSFKSIQIGQAEEGRR